MSVMIMQILMNDQCLVIDNTCYTCLCICIHVCIYIVHACVCVCVHMPRQVHVYERVCMCVCVHVYMCT